MVDKVKQTPEKKRFDLDRKKGRIVHQDGLHLKGSLFGIKFNFPLSEDYWIYTSRKGQTLEDVRKHFDLPKGYLRSQYPTAYNAPEKVYIRESVLERALK